MIANVKFMDLPLLCNVFTHGSSVHINHLFSNSNLHFLPFPAKFTEARKGQMTSPGLHDESLNEPRKCRIFLAPSPLYHTATRGFIFPFQLPLNLKATG